MLRTLPNYVLPVLMPTALYAVWILLRRRRLQAAGAGGCPACGKARGSGSSSPGWLS